MISIDKARSLGEHLPKILGALLKNRLNCIRLNLSLAFPDWPEEKREALIQANIKETGACLLETAYVTLRNAKAITNRSKVLDREVLDRALATGKHVLLLSAHYTCMDSCGVVMANDAKVDVIYRHQNSAVAEYLMTKSRSKIYYNLIHRDDTAQVIRILRDKSRQRILWMAPDQDFGKARSVFVPFLGVVKAATLAIPSRIVTDYDMVPVFIEFRYDKSEKIWTIKYKDISNYPTGDLETDAATFNHIIGESVLECPEQYYWVHRRFKTKENGETRNYRNPS